MDAAQSKQQIEEGRPSENGRINAPSYERVESKHQHEDQRHYGKMLISIDTSYCLPSSCHYKHCLIVDHLDDIINLSGMMGFLAWVMCLIALLF